MSFVGLTAAEFVLLFAASGLVLSLLTLLGLRLRAASVATLPLWRRLVRQRRTTLRRILTMLLQLAVLLLLSLAVADPRPPAARHQDAWQLVLLVDTSASMAAGAPESRLQRAGRLVTWLAGQARRRDSFLLLEFAARPRWHYGPGPGGPELVKAVRALRVRQEPDDAGRAWEAVERWLAARPADTPPVRLVLFSDRFHEVPAHLAESTWQVAVDGARDNLAVSQLELFPAAGGRQLQARVRVDNYSSNRSRVELVLHTARVLLGRNRLTLDPGQSRRLNLLLPPPAEPEVMATLSSADDRPPDALELDDRAYALAPRPRRRRLLLAGKPNRFLELALRLQPVVELQSQPRPPDPAQAGAYSAAVFNGICPPWPGPALYWAPPPERDCPFASSVASSTPEALQVSGRHPLVAGLPLQTLALQKVRHLYPRVDDRQLLADSRGPLLLAREQPVRQIAVGFELASSDLPLRVAFPLLMDRLVEWLAGPAMEQPLPPLRLGDTLRLPGSPERVGVSDPQGRRWPDFRLGPGELWRPDQAGLWRLQGEGGTRSVAVNFFSASESDLRQSPRPGARKLLAESGLPPRQLAAWFAGPEAQTSGLMWPRLLLAAAWLLLCEWLAFCWRLLF